jgi:hypothetical protein
MAIQLNSRQCLLRMMSCCFALALAFLFAQPASAAIMHSGTFAEDGSSPDTAPDSLSLTNDASSTEDILTIVIDLTNAAAAGTEFDIVGGGSFGFSASGAEIAEVGFQSAVVGGANMTLTLTFNDFEAGETFDFTIDLDHSNPGGAIVDGADLAGSEITATFAITGGLTAVMADAGGMNAGWVAAIPEPNTLALLGLGMTGLAWGGRRRR